MSKKLSCHIFILSLIVVGGTSCIRDLSQSKGYDDLVIYPSPPDTARIQYLTSVSISTDIKGKQSAFNKFIFGEDVPKPVIKPYGITTSGSKVYICDTGIGGLVLINPSDKSFEYFIPSGKGKLQLPLNASVDENGNLFVADANRRQIVVFNNELNYVSEFGEATETFKPTDVNVTGDKVFVVSVKDQKIFVYEKNTWKKLNSFPSAEEGEDGYLYQPTNIVVDDNFVYVSDLGDNKVKVFSVGGEYIRSVGGYGAYAGQLMRPKGVAVDKESNLYIVDAAFENTQIFNSSGKVLMSFGGAYRSHGDMWLPVDVSVSYSGLEFYSKFVDPSFNLKYLIFVTNQYGPDKISVYGFVETKNNKN
jgi:DNA-binding beta-propeller fold protein YncE